MDGCTERKGKIKESRDKKIHPLPSRKYGPAVPLGKGDKSLP
jgi:hypothetical protein